MGIRVYVRKVPLWHRSVDDRDKEVNAPHRLAPSDFGEHGCHVSIFVLHKLFAWGMSMDGRWHMMLKLGCRGEVR